jgi:hypothetical protein
MKRIDDVMAAQSAELRGQVNAAPTEQAPPRPIRTLRLATSPSEPTCGTAEAGAKVRRAGAPADVIESIKGIVLKRLQKSRAAEAAESWWSGMRGERPLLALLGPTGLGKSTAAGWAAFLCAREYPWNAGAGGGGAWDPIVWHNAEDLALLQSWFDDGKRQYEEAQRAWLLVIDDAGHEKTRPAIAALSELLLRRIDQNRATILSTNLRGARFGERYGAPVVDRMKVKAFIPELGSFESLRGREPGEEG